MPTIMIVDDEPPIRQLVARVLERRGYKVMICGSADEALAHTDAPDLLLVDLVLPGMNGRQLTELLRARIPNLPVVLMSGYLPEPDLTPAPPSAFLQKPMTPSAVVEAIDRLLNPQTS